ncbi:MAG: DNA repair protein RecO [Acidobacteriota bacterium]
MSIQSSEAIVLRSFNFAELDKIVVLFTKEKGIIRVIAKGAKKFKNRFGSSLEPMSYIKIVYYEKETRDLLVLKTADLIESFFEIQKDFDTIKGLSYISEVIEGFIPHHLKEDLVFRLLLSILRALKNEVPLPLILRYFEGWILKLSGFLPNFTKCRNCKTLIEEGWLSQKMDGIYCSGCSTMKKFKINSDFNQFIDFIKKNSPEHMKNLNYSEERLKIIENILKQMLFYHLEKTPKSLL